MQAAIRITEQSAAWSALRRHGVPEDRILILDGEKAEVPPHIEGVIINNQRHFPLLMRKLEPAAMRGCLILPADPDWVVSADLRSADKMHCAWKTSAAANYVSRCNLRGHYLEFGVFWGASFFPNYFRLRDWLRGQFFAFDSFAGLSAPQPEELHNTGGDFHEGAYACNQRSFTAMADFVGMPEDRLKIIPGFYDKTLNRPPGDYGIEPRSVSICYIDCDLYDPTLQVLDFVMPTLEDGALLYFDDWRLTRASPRVGERAAALQWLARHPEIELIEFDRTHWQHQWFIFQRR